MTYDREEDILYLAHELWEEQAASFPSARSCWQYAAREVLSGGRSRYSHRDETVVQARTFLQFGSSPMIEPGQHVSTSRISMITHFPQVDVANPAIFLVQISDRT